MELAFLTNEVSFETIDVICWGESTGSIEVMIGLNSGTPPYTYQWTGPNLFYNNVDEDLYNLYAGTYGLTITDGNGCDRLDTWSHLVNDIKSGSSATFFGIDSKDQGS